MSNHKYKEAKEFGSFIESLTYNYNIACLRYEEAQESDNVEDKLCAL